MQTPIQAMLWELMRTSRVEILLRVGAMCCFMVMTNLVSRDLGDFQNQVVRGVAVTMLMMTAPFSQTWLGELDSNSRGFCFRLGFVRPISTLQLVLVPLLFVVLSSMACYLIPAVLASYLWNSPMPLLGPALLIALIVQLSVAVVWSCATRSSKVLGIVLLAIVIMGLAVFFVIRSNSPDPILLALSRPGYFDLSWQQYLLCFAIMLATTIATVFAVDRQRHGDEWEFTAITRIFGYTRTAGTFTQSIRHPFRTMVTAQCWYEWRQFGTKVLIAGILASVFVISFLVVCNLLYPGRNPNTVTWIIALVLSPVFFQMIGTDGAIGLKNVHGATRLSLFDATRSLSNDQIIFVKLIVIAASSLVAWLCMATAAGIDLFLLGNSENWTANHLVPTALADAIPKISAQMGYVGWLVGLSNFLLLFVSSSSSFLAFGLWLPVYRWRIVLAGAILVLHASILVFALKYGWRFPFALTAYGYLLAGLTIFVCVASIWESLKLGAMRRSYFIAFGSLWAIYVISAVVLFSKVAAHIPIAIPTVAIVLLAALLMVPLAATAVAPLAYATHRNR
ncbi:MAG: hypothetical protein ABL921_24700 [Pirellula sp.]